MNPLDQARLQFLEELKKVGVEEQRRQFLQLFVEMMQVHKESFESTRYHETYRRYNSLTMVPKYPDV